MRSTRSYGWRCCSMCVARARSELKMRFLAKLVP